ncbi:MAG: DUF5723 family protein [Bacteroidota bacterium]
MRSKEIVFFALSFLIYSISSAQSFHGFGSSTYGGAHNVVFNPALIVSLPNKMDINVFSAYSVIGSDYSFVKFGDGIGFREGFQFGDDRNTTKDDNNFYRNVDVLGPAFMHRLNENSSIGIHSRIRGVFNVNNLNGRLLQNAEDGFEEDEDFTTRSKDFSAAIHAWGELGLTYGLQVHMHNYSLAFGATVKYLQGAGSIFASSPSIETDYRAENETLETKGELLFGYTPGFESNKINFNSVTGGFAFDVGIVFESEHVDFLWGKTLRMGISLNDFGSIKYDNTIRNTYDINKTVFARIYDEDDFRRILNQAYDKEVEVVGQKIKLPTTIHLFSDVDITKEFFFGIESSISLVSKKRTNSNRIYNYFTLNPRLEKKWLSLYSPISLQQHTGLSWGMGIRIGIVVLGSETFLSNIIFSSKTNDVYVGVRVPFYD